jgi:outer membrane protein TolC
VVEPDERPVEELLAMARERRSDLRQLELMEGLRRAELRLERWSYLPSVSLFGTYSMAAQENEFNFFGGSDGQRGYGRLAGVRVTVPVFAGFQRPARIAQREAVVEQVRVQQDRALDQVESQIRTLHEQATEARRRADSQRRAVEQAQRGYRIASVEYREGLGTRLNLTDAEVALRRAEFNYAQSVYDYLAARARIDEAVGAVPDFD